MERLCCFFKLDEGVGDKGGGTGETGEKPWPGFRAVCGGNPPVNVLGGAGGGPADC